MLQDERPRHKILCKRRYYRYVVACMHNCVEPHFCREFWTFFSAKGLTPAEYHNEGGIGDAIMRRIVFDCDRCGKRDLDTVFGRYDQAGEGEEHLLGEDARSDLIVEVGHKDPMVESLTFGTLRTLEDGLGWLHYCRRCFSYMADNLAKVANVKKPARPPKPRPKPEPEPAPKPAVAPESGPVTPPTAASKPKPAVAPESGPVTPPTAEPKPEPKPKAKPKAKAKATPKQKEEAAPVAAPATRLKSKARKTESGGLLLTKTPSK